MTALYVRCRAEARDRSTWRLRRLERRARARVGAGLGPVELRRWAAIRAELRARGVRLPDAEARPWWWRR